MGLDQYLTRKTYAFGKIKEVIPIEKHKSIENINTSKITYIYEEICYWRKANAIHGWFTRLKHWDEESQSITVSQNELQKLVQICSEVLADNSKAKDLLPTHEGFFFGGLNYDDYYYNTLRQTIDELIDIKDCPYIYEASW